MAFWNKVGHALGAPLRAPGMSAITRPINAGLQATPGLRGVPAAMGMGPKPNPGIGPSAPPMGPPPPDQGVPIQQGPPPPMMGPPPPPPQGPLMMGGPFGTSPQIGQGPPQIDPQTAQMLQNLNMQQSGGPQLPQRGMPQPGLGPSPNMMNQMGGMTRRMIPPRGMPQ